MRTLKDFKSLTEIFDDETEIVVELPTGEICEIRGFQPTDKNNALMIIFSPRPHDFRKKYMEE